MAGRIARTILFGFIVLLVTAGCLIVFSESEADRRYGSLEEAIEKGLPWDVKDVIHVREIEDVTAVLYAFETDNGQIPHADRDFLGVAFFEGGDREGWKPVGLAGGAQTRHGNMTVHFERLGEHYRSGNFKRSLYVAFGEINNREIVKVETRAQDEEAFEEADIIEHEGRRFWFQEGPELIARGLSGDGTVIEQQGG